MQQLIYERGSNALPELNKVDHIFGKLQVAKPSEHRPILVKMEKLLSRIFATTVVVQLQQGRLSDNFAVLPILKPNKTGKATHKLKPNSVKLLHVDVLYLLIGVDLVKESKPRQMTAILLHEIGHVTEHITQTSAMIEMYLDKVKFVTDLLSRIPIINFIFSPLFIITSRTLNFRNHAYEYGADVFAIKYGYGDDLAEWCVDAMAAPQPKIPKNLTGLTYILKHLFEGSSHPSFKKRVIAVIKEMKSNYSKQYGDERVKEILDKYYKT